MLSKRCYIKLSVVSGVIKALVLLLRTVAWLEKPLHQVEVLLVADGHRPHHGSLGLLLVDRGHLLLLVVEPSSLHELEVLDEVLLLGLDTAPVAHVPEGKVQVVAE